MKVVRYWFEVEFDPANTQPSRVPDVVGDWLNMLNDAQLQANNDIRIKVGPLTVDPPTWLAGQRLRAAQEGTPDQCSGYEHYLAMLTDGEKPFGFDLWRTKRALLDRLLDRDPDGKDPTLDAQIRRLSQELRV